MKNCVSCGQQIANEKKFCGFCGTTQPEVQASPAPAVPQGTGAAVSADESKVKKPANPRSKRLVLISIAAALVAVVGVLLAMVLMKPAALTAKDITASVTLADPTPKWSGDSVTLLSSLTLNQARTDEYKAVVEQLDLATNKWTSVAEQPGSGPAFVITTTAKLLEGENQFRVSLYSAKDGTLLVSSESTKVATKVAGLPTECPIDALNASGDGGLEVFGGDIENGKDCTFGYPNSDMIVRLVYTKVTQAQWEKQMEFDAGTATTVGLGESAAYVYTQAATELSTEYDVYVINYHGIMIQSELGRDYLHYAIDAIPVK